MRQALSTGDLLRWWRTDVLELSQSEAARRLGRSPGALSAWENGKATPTLDSFTIDERLGAGGSLGRLLWAVHTPMAFAPDVMWSHVFRDELSPTWAWVRAAGDRALDVHAGWGVTRADLRAPAGNGGSVFWVPVSMPEQPLFVRLSAPGWVDFGQGPLPPTIMTVPVIDSRREVRRVGHASQILGEVGRRAAVNLRRLGLSTTDLQARLPPRLVSLYLDVDAADQQPHWVEAVDGAHGEQPNVPRASYAQVRAARGLSYQMTSEILKTRLDYTISPDTVRRFETTERWTPGTLQLMAALDTGLDAGGRLATGVVQTSDDKPDVNFPRFWRAPVWLEFTGISSTETVRLTWGGWRKEFELTEPTVVSTHCIQPEIPLRIQASGHVAWRAGIGRRPGARIVDHNWSPTSNVFASEVRALALDRSAAAFNVSRARVRHFLGE